MIEKLKIICAITATVVILGVGYDAVDGYINWRETGTSVKNVPWLPDVATNVSYTRTNNGRANAP